MGRAAQVGGQSSGIVVCPPRRVGRPELFASAARFESVGSDGAQERRPYFDDGRRRGGASWVVNIARAIAAAAVFVALPFGVRAAQGHAGCDAVAIDVAAAPNADARAGLAAAIADIRRDVPQLSLAVGVPTAPDHSVITVRWVPRLDGTEKSPTRTVGKTNGFAGPVAGAVRPSVWLLSSATLPAIGDRSWEAVARHELGHALGLAHSAERGDVMFPTIDGMGAHWSDAERAQLNSLGDAPDCLV